MNTKVPVTLQPVAGFCVKTSVLQSAVYSPANATYQGPQTLEPKDVLIPIPKGLKVFINIAWDANVPPPPEGSDDAIQQAMKGEDIDELNPEGWYVPVIVSEGRQDKDKCACHSLRNCGRRLESGIASNAYLGLPLLVCNPALPI